MGITENKFNGLLVVVSFIMFFTPGVVNSQNNAQNEQQVKSTQRFIDLDADRDGFISKSEFQNTSFDKFDLDQNGKLSRNEYRELNRSVKRTQNATQSGNGLNQSNKQNKNKGMKSGNGPGNKLGVCPNVGNKIPKKNCKPKGKGRNF